MLLQERLLVLWLKRTKLFILHFRETKIDTRPFKAGACLFEQVLFYCKQAATHFKLADTCSEGNIIYLNSDM